MYKISRNIARNSAFGFGMENTSNIRADQGAMILFSIEKLYGLGVLQMDGIPMVLKVPVIYAPIRIRTSFSSP